MVIFHDDKTLNGFVRGFAGLSLYRRLRIPGLVPYWEWIGLLCARSALWRQLRLSVNISVIFRRLQLSVRPGPPRQVWFSSMKRGKPVRHNTLGLSSNERRFGSTYRQASV